MVVRHQVVEEALVEYVMEQLQPHHKTIQLPLELVVVTVQV